MCTVSVSLSLILFFILLSCLCLRLKPVNMDKEYSAKKIGPFFNRVRDGLKLKVPIFITV